MVNLIIDILDLVEPLKPKLELIADRCIFTVHCNYVVNVEGGWELSPTLLERMSNLRISFLFSLDEHSKPTQPNPPLEPITSVVFHRHFLDNGSAA
jgi:hypothetical protein